MTTVNDLVLIYFEDQPLTYARVEDILPDAKPDWYHVKLLMLQIPLQIVTWILRDSYIDGTEFTMNGKKLRIERVEPPPQTDSSGNLSESSGKEASPDEDSSKRNVISIKDHKKR